MSHSQNLKHKYKILMEVFPKGVEFLMALSAPSFHLSWVIYLQNSIGNLHFRRQEFRNLKNKNNKMCHLLHICKSGIVHAFLYYKKSPLKFLMKSHI